MNPKLASAIAATSHTPELTPEPFQMVDTRAEKTWIEGVKFREPNVDQKRKTYTNKLNSTSGENYAPKRWKKDNEYLFHPGIVNLPTESCE